MTRHHDIIVLGSGAVGQTVAHAARKAGLASARSGSVCLDVATAWTRRSDLPPSASARTSPVVTAPAAPETKHPQPDSLPGATH